MVASSGPKLLDAFRPREEHLPKARRTYEVPPDPSLMEDIGATSFTVAEAIVELVANSIDARLDEDRLAVDVSVDTEEILVIDDARGMDEATLAEAVRLGVKMDAIKGRRRPRKGMFGLGMKTAAASLGRYWAVHTRPAEGSAEFSVEFDLGSYARRRGDRDFKWAVAIIETAPDVDGPLGHRDHGTAIVIRQLRSKNPMAGPVRELLGNAYKPHIEQGDRIVVNGSEAIPRAYDFLEGTRHEIDAVAGSEGQFQITGWVALDKQTHNAADYGLNLYRLDQLVEAWNKDWFRAHLMTSRIIGEAHIDFVPVNFNKQGFQKQSAEWRQASDAMREWLKPIVRASNEVSRGRNDAGKFARAREGLDRAMGKADAVGVLDPLEGEADGPIGGPTLGGTPPTRPVDAEVAPNAIHLPDAEVPLSYVVADWASEETPWDYLWDPDTRELQAVINSNSRLYRQVKDEAFLGMLAIADCVTRFLVEEREFTARRAREIRDRWLFVTLGEG